MVRLREIPRTAAFAWSPGSTAPWIATGTKSGAVDIDFSNETCLELWDLALDDTAQEHELKPMVTLPTDSGSVATSLALSSRLLILLALASTTLPGLRPAVLMNGVSLQGLLIMVPWACGTWIGC